MTAAATMLFAVNRSRFTASVDHTSVNASGRLPTLTTGSVTVTPIGGQDPYVAVWSQVDGDGMGAWTINSPNSFETTFTCSGIPDGQTAVGIFSCTVTDAIGDPPATTVPVTAYAQNTL